MRMFPPKSSGIRRSPGYLPAVVWLDAVFDPGVSALCSSLSHSPLGLLPVREDRHAPDIRISRGYVSDSGLHPSPRHTRLIFLPACAFSRFTTERLTNLTQKGLGGCPPFPLDRQPLPGHPYCLLFFVFSPSPTLLISPSSYSALRYSGLSNAGSFLRRTSRIRRRAPSFSSGSRIRRGR